MPKEITIERALVKRITELGGKCIKLTGYKGIPDRLVLLPWGKTYFVELKTTNGKLSALQYQWFDVLKILGFPAIVIRDKESLDLFFPLPKL